MVLRNQDSARTEEPTLAEIGALETEPDWASHELDQLRKSLSDQVARITVEGRESRVRAPMDELHAMRVDRNYLEARLKEVLAEREALNDSLSAARLSLQQATREASAQRAELASLREQAAALREKLQGASKRLDGLAGQRDRDEARIGALEAENARLMQRLQALQVSGATSTW